MNANAFMDGVRAVFAQLDKFIYWIVGIIYDLIEVLAKFQLFGNDLFSKFSTKIYGILGLFMLFKISFSLLNYIVDPDSFSDKSKGMGSIVKNIIIVLILIILAPFAFDLMTEAQNIILDEDILERFIFGINDDENYITVNKSNYKDFQMNSLCGDKFATVNGEGHFISLSVFSAFYQPNFDILFFYQYS